MTYNELLAAIRAAIGPNGKRQITGQSLQDVLVNIATWAQEEEEATRGILSTSIEHTINANSAQIDVLNGRVDEGLATLTGLVEDNQTDINANSARIDVLNGRVDEGLATLTGLVEDNQTDIANLKAALLAGIDLNSINDGIFIMFHRNRDNYPVMVKPDKWPSLQNSGEIANGVVVVEGCKILVVSPTETALTWSSAAVSGGGVTTTSPPFTAMNDWAGKANTAAQIKHAECSGESYAPGFCAKYSRVNANGRGLTAGKWWLPSLGELMMIYANMRKVNYALSLIEGATQLGERSYWSSTEHSATYAWFMNLDNGVANNNAKASVTIGVRPVSSFVS